MKTTLLIIVALAFGWMAQASIIIDGQGLTSLPTGPNSGLVSTATVSGESGLIQNIRVCLNISGIPNGNLYAYLRHGDDLVVLLNRVGRTGTAPAGFQDVGLNVIFEPGMLDVHQYRLPGSPLSGALTGAWGVDGRLVDPRTVLETDTPSTSLSSLVGKDPNGDWVLFVANMGSEGTGAMLESWGLEMNYSAVPEASTWISGMACLLLICLQPVARRK